MPPAGAQLGLGLPGQTAGGRPQTRQPNPGGSEIEEWARQLRDDDPVLRLEAVKQLAKQKDEKAIQYLIEATADEDLRVRLKAIESLGDVHASAATPILVQSLYLSDSKPWLKKRVLVALGKIGDARAARPIADFLSRDSDVATLGTAIFALGEIGDKSALDELEKIAHSPPAPSLGRVARDAIAKINQKQIHPELELHALRADDDDVRPATASAAPPLAY